MSSTTTEPVIDGEIIANATPAPKFAIPTPGQVRVAPIGLGSALPDRVVTSAEIEQQLGVEPGWLVSRTHIEERRFLADDETHAELGAKAARAALLDAKVQADELDLVICATCSSDEITPAGGALIADLIGAKRIGAFDIQSACAGFATAISMASGMIESGRFKTILVVGVEALSRMRNPTCKATAGLIADGAGAMVLRAASHSDGGIGQIGPAVIGSDGSLADTVVIERKTGQLVMNGHETYLTAVNIFTQLVKDTAAAAGATVEDFDIIAMHQANGRIIDAVRRRLDIPEEKMLKTVEKHGNTSAASIPLALSESYKSGQLKPGSRVLMAGFGAGLSWAGVSLIWEGRS